MDTPPAPAHQFQAQNTQYPPPEQQYAPHSALGGPVPLHQSAQTPQPQPSEPPKPAPVSKERTRHSSACFPCAKRKVKCDRDIKNPCSNCLKRDQGHLCEVKSQKDRISHHRASDPASRDAHRDKRPKFEAFQSTFRSTPAANGYLPAHADDPYGLSPPHARMTADYGPSDYNPPCGQRTSVSMLPRKTDADARWDAIEELLPQKRDLLKYIGTYRNNGPHFINPTTTGCDVFESQACLLLTETDTPQIRDRLSESNPNAEVELTRLARLLAVLATGSRIEDSDPQVQAAIAQDYVRRAFRCLQLANYQLRPIVETVETLLLLAQELLNEHQPILSWTIIGTASRLSRIVEPEASIHLNGPIAPKDLMSQADHAALTNTSLHDTIVSSLIKRCTPAQVAALQHHADEAKYLNQDIATVLTQLYALIPDNAIQPPRSRHINHSPDRWPPNSPPSQNHNYHSDLSRFEHHVDNLQRRFRLADLANCKSIRDRYEHYTFRLHCSFVTALVTRPALGDRGFVLESQDSSAGRTLERAHLDAIRAFSDFSSISNLPVRTWWMVLFVLDAVLELFSVAQAPDGQLVANLLPRLLGVLESGAHVLSRRHQDALGLVGRIARDLQSMDGDRQLFRAPPDELRRELAEVRGALASGDDLAGNGLVQQVVFGL